MNNKEDFLKNLKNEGGKMLTVDIQDDLETLKGSGYKLCIAKKMIDSSGEVCNVIWASVEDYLELVEFSWVPVYEVFATNSFQDKIKVSTNAAPVKMNLGEKIVYNSAGKFEYPKSGGTKGDLKIINEHQGIHFGVNQIIIDADGTRRSTPIFVSRASSIKGTATYTPIEKVVVWFQEKAKTSTMFEEIEGLSIEVDLTDYESKTIQYKNGDWKII